MITIQNLRNILEKFNFSTKDNNLYKKEYPQGASIAVDFNNQKIIYEPLDATFENGEFPTKENPSNGFVIHRDTTLNFKANENFVCLLCVHFLLEKGYEPKHIVFEPAFKVGHINKPSYGDILVFDKEYNPLVLVENKTYGNEFSNEWNNMQKDGGQLFSYLGPLVNTLGFCENLVLFAADFDEKPILKSHIITLKDNEKRISEIDNPKTFSNAQGKYFEVWNETYAKSFETKGLFEDDIEAYSIGKLKYTINDLKELSHAEIRPIYHEFATILRNHAITDFEHSFYILIDLFLCKITDERKNPNDLQFYYKGITRDTPKEYCARLLKLYKQGMHDLFNVEVVNKEEDDIKNIFEDTSRSLTNGLFDGIKKLFEEMKFYNIKKFNFIEVENKENFEYNFQILIKIAALIQDINLSNSETNHFFGDLFEGLLSKNVHQTEGQFFTPLPIVNFIINSLPEFTNTQNVKVLDYACGAGHFLTEFVKAYPDAKAYGIEKSQPLSQVAKIATIINGNSDARIIFKDSLSSFNTNLVKEQGFDNDSFDCIIANPPYSVKGFLNTLTEKDRNQFELTHFVDKKSLEATKSIECFFVERSKHFLKQNGIMAIVLPSSILSNGNLYIKVREILFENFNILSIVNLGSRTFGSTGTNTIVLIAQKVKKNSHGLLENFIKNNRYEQYTNYTAVDSYIKKQGYPLPDFYTFMQRGIMSDELANHDFFIDYKKNFKPQPLPKTIQNEWFKASTFFDKKIKENTKEYKKIFQQYLKTEEYKQYAEIEYKKQFVIFAQKIECDKLNTFIQIEDNNVVILQSPQDKVGNKSNKTQIIKFLGYDWSNRKGDEGIKYVTSIPELEDTGETEGTDKEDKDAEIVNAINSIKFIDTPLYNPDNSWDETKFSFAIRKHIYQQCNKFSFTSEKQENENLHKEFACEMGELLFNAKLSDMIDFSKTEFDKAIKCNVQKTEIKIESKFPLVKLEEIATLQKGKAITSAEAKAGTVKVVAGGTDFAYFHNESNRPSNIITVSASGANAGFVNYWSEPIFASDCTTILTNDISITKYIFNFLKANQDIVFHLQKGAAQPHVYADDLKALPIPYPSIGIQKSIVAECDSVDTDYQIAKKSIDDYKNQISEIIKNVKGENLTIGEIGKICMCKRIKKNETNSDSGIPFYKIGTFGKKATAYISKKLFDKYVNEYPYPKKGQILISAAGTLGKAVAFDGKPAYFQDSNIVWIDNNESKVKNSYLLNVLAIIDWKKYATEGSIIPRIYNENLRNVIIPVPSLAEQEKIVSQITALENKISEAKQTLAACPKRKQDILDKWLK